MDKYDYLVQIFSNIEKYILILNIVLMIFIEIPKKSNHNEELKIKN